ncbi:MAG: AGE family epimerase/isomerase [Chitinophagaceae bacterium]|nr:AGE family epimerase/isomerase [Chitinophagaceae bacterium]
MTIENYIHLYQDALLNDVVPFWERNSPDKINGGFFTCLDRQGQVYDTDKFIWLQGRQVWTFSMLYNNLEKRQSWLDLALHGADFLEKHGRDEDGNWYFSLTREGRPLTAPYNIFSDCFATMAFAQLYKATGVEKYRKIATDTFDNILKRKNNPAGKYSKKMPGVRPLQGFSLPMILSNLVLEIEHTLPKQMVEETIAESVNLVMNVFYKPEYGVILENVLDTGEFCDCYEGRLINPGHGLEATWFMMDIAKRQNNPALMQKAVSVAIQLMEYGWDKEYGGIFYFLDLKGAPPQQLEWDQKLWWVHQEASLALLKGYYYTGNGECWSWYKKLHDYTWSHFPDKKYGEWFGYLNRRGEVLLPLKGGKWKGCFHAPRFLLQGWKTFERMVSQKLSIV